MQRKYDAEKIYRVDLISQDNVQAVVSRPFARSFTASSPH